MKKCKCVQCGETIEKSKAVYMYDTDIHCKECAMDLITLRGCDNDILDTPVICETCGKVITESKDLTPSIDEHKFCVGCAINYIQAK